MLFRLAACGALLLLIPATVWSKPEGIAVSGIDQSALVFRASSLKNGELPARIVTRDGAHVFASQLTLACLGRALQPQDLVVYFTQSRKCESMPGPSSAREQAGWQSAGVATLSGARAPVEEALLAQPVVVLQPQAQAPVVAGLCVCRGDAAPVVTVEAGSGQTALVGGTIQTIEFAATDVDSPTLSYEFSWTLDGGTSTDGLPGALAPSCSDGPGTLNCSVDGPTPPQAGIYLIRLLVGDGLNFSHADALVTVDVPSEIIFHHGFEDD